MNKKRVLSLVLSFALVFTTVFAGAGSVFAGEKVATKSVVKAALKGKAATSAYIPFNHNTVDWEDEDEVEDIVNEKQAVYESSLSVKVSKKGHYLHEFTIAGTSSGYATVSVIDPKGNEIASERVFLEYYEEYDAALGYAFLETGLTKTGTYKVAVSSEIDGAVAVSYLCHYLPQSTKTSPVSILNGGEKLYDNPSNGYSWFKVKVDGTSTVSRNLTIQFSEEGTFQVRLYKSNKSTVLGGGTVNVGSGKDYTTYYAVPKGTYYVRIYKKESVTPYYGIKMTTSKVTEKSGATKAKAVKVGKNVLKKGTILATENATTSVDWYKVTLSKAQKFYMHLNFKTGGIAKGGIKITVYKKGQSKAVLTKKFASGTSSWDWKIYTTGNNGKLAKGTYYFKVQKYNYGTGYYSMKWNNSSK